jgi:hypothetical protein
VIVLVDNHEFRLPSRLANCAKNSGFLYRIERPVRAQIQIVHTRPARRGPGIGLRQLGRSRGHGDQRHLSSRRIHEASGGRRIHIGACSGVGETTLRNLTDRGQKAL